MTGATPTLHMLCGKVAAGKSTLAAELAGNDATILIAEDEWLSALFANEMSSAQDYMRCAAKLRGAIGPHIVSLLNSGVSVVLDFQANTVESRKWMLSILGQTSADHLLHVLDPPDDVCLARLRRRNASGDHPFAVSEEQYHHFAKYFARPDRQEGFKLKIHDQA